MKRHIVDLNDYQSFVEEYHGESDRSAIVMAGSFAESYLATYDREQLSAVLYVASCFAIGGGILAWCTCDSLARGVSLTQREKAWIGLLGPVFVPVYFVQSRGMAVSAKSLFGLLLYAPFYAAFYAVWYATVFVMTRMGYFSAQ